jgi:hypothetical protein
VNGRDYGIVVGIDLYPGLGSLEGAQRDAESFAGWLVDPDGGGLPSENVRTILTRQFHPPPPPRTALADPGSRRFYAAVCDLLMDEVGNLRDFPVGRRLYLYFSGHGFQGDSNFEEAALYTANATFNLPEHIPGTREADAMRAAAAFQEIVLIMDCCRDVQLTRRISEAWLCLPRNETDGAAVRTCYAFAARRGYQAQERQIEGNIQGVFTHVLLEALRRTPGDGEGRVTGQAIKNYIHNRWPDLVSSEISTSPRIEVDSANDVVLVVRPVGPPEQAENTPDQLLTQVVFSLVSPVDDGTEVVVMDGQLREIKRLPVRDNSASCRLVPGIYKASIDGTNRQKLFQAIGGDTHEQL